MQKLIEKSKKVLLDCCLPNGAIIAANTDRPDYPHQVQSYRYVWPRDAAYICYALELLELKEPQLRFFRWLARAEDLEQTGLLFQNYYTNGRKRWIAFQPDQNGGVLWALNNFIKKNPEHKKRLVPMMKLLADGLCKVWDKDHFSQVTQDLWEEFFTYPEMKTTITYSLAACAHGLKCANEIQSNKKYVEVSKQMRDKIQSSYHKNAFIRRSGIVNDYRPDISVLGLVWPFGIFDAKDDKMRNTVVLIHKTLEKDGHFHRYQFDDYDCFKYQGTDARRGAGTWPIGNFWMSIYYHLKDDKNKAKEYHDNVLKRLDKNLNIPEQLFDNNIQVAVKPLAWSHAMCIIASYLRNEDSF